MRKTMLTLVTVGTLALAGCNSTSFTLTAEQLATIQAFTETACGFVPTAITIADIVTGSNPAIIPASTIATQICAAVTKQSATRAVGVEKKAQITVQIGGKNTTVEVTGHFVR